MSAKKARYCIGELSTLCNIPQKTLRYYDEIGLFTPDYRDDSTHYRYYSKSQIVNLMIIKTLKQMGFPLKDIRQIISENDAQSLEANINSHLETMRDDIMKRIDQYTECSYLLQKIQNGFPFFIGHGYCCSVVKIFFIYCLIPFTDGQFIPGRRHKIFINDR